MTPGQLAVIDGQRAALALIAAAAEHADDGDRAAAPAGRLVQGRLPARRRHAGQALRMRRRVPGRRAVPSRSRRGVRPLAQAPRARQLSEENPT